MGNQTKIEIVNDAVWWRKGVAMSPLDIILKFAYIAGLIIAGGLPTSEPMQGSKEMNEAAKNARRRLMQLIFEGTGIQITDSGNLSSRKIGGVKSGDIFKINRTLKMKSSTFDFSKMIDARDYSSQLHRHQLKAWGIEVPKISQLSETDFDRAIDNSGNADTIGANAPLKESLQYAFNGIHRRDNKSSIQLAIAKPKKVDLDAARNLL